jgi:hypothetical protein
MSSWSLHRLWFLEICLKTCHPLTLVCHAFLTRVLKGGMEIQHRRACTCLFNFLQVHPSKSWFLVDIKALNATWVFILKRRIPNTLFLRVWPNFDFYHHRRMLKCFYFLIFCSQIWLCLVHDHHYNPQVNYIGFQEVVNNIEGCLSVFGFLFFIAKFGYVVLCIIAIVITSKIGKNKRNNN